MAAEISAQLVRELREQTGAGMMDCKRALQDTNGDMEAAVVLLREKGMANAAKRADREPEAAERDHPERTDQHRQPQRAAPGALPGGDREGDRRGDHIEHQPDGGARGQCGQPAPEGRVGGAGDQVRHPAPDVPASRLIGRASVAALLAVAA